MAEAFAVYSADDASLRFYKRDTVPTAGETFEGRTATEVYTGVETDIYQLSTIPWRNYQTMIRTFSIEDVVSPVSTALWCRGMPNIESIDLLLLDTSQTIQMNSMFSNCYYLTELDLSSFDTSCVTTMRTMFKGCWELKTIYVSDRWNVSALQDSYQMFFDCDMLVGDIAYDSSIVDATYATYEGGYLTYRKYVPSELRDDFLVRGETLYEIADAIREKTESTDAIAVTDMASKIAGIETGGGTETYTNTVKNLLPCDAYIVYYNTATSRMTYATLAAGATGEYQGGTNFPLLILAKDDAYADFDVSCLAGSIVPTSNRASWTMSSGDVFRGVMTVTFAPSVIEVGYFG